jgi:hypothetical protein
VFKEVVQGSQVPYDGCPLLAHSLLQSGEQRLEPHLRQLGFDPVTNGIGEFKSGELPRPNLGRSFHRSRPRRLKPKPRVESVSVLCM